MARAPLPYRLDEGVHLKDTDTLIRWGETLDVLGDIARCERSNGMNSRRPHFATMGTGHVAVSIEREPVGYKELCDRHAHVTRNHGRGARVEGVVW